MARSSFALVLAVSAVCAAPAAAQTAAPPPASAPVDACSVEHPSRLQDLACRIDAGLPKLPREALVVSATVESDVPAVSKVALGERLVRLIAGRLGVRASSTEGASLARARGLASDAGTLVYLTPKIARGRLELTADVYRVAESFWDRVQNLGQNPIAHAFAEGLLDAELHTFLPPVPLIAQHVDKAVLVDPTTVALSCGDLDGDLNPEVVAVGRHRISVGTVRAGRLTATRSVAWADLSPVSASPLRQPLASAVIAPGRHLDVAISDRRHGVRLAPDLATVARFEGLFPWPGGGCVARDGLSLAPALVPCVPGDPAPGSPRLDQPLDALAGEAFFSRNGAPRFARAGRLFNLDQVSLRDERGRKAESTERGAQLALADVDFDGQVDLISATNAIDPKEDALVVQTWLDKGELVERLRLPVPTGVRAVTVCPPIDGGLRPIVLASESELWVVR